MIYRIISAFKKVIKDWGILEILLVVAFTPFSLIYMGFRFIQEWEQEIKMENYWYIHVINFASAIFLILSLSMLKKKDPKLAMFIHIVIAVLLVLVSSSAGSFIVSYLAVLWTLYLAKVIIWDKQQEEVIRINIRDVIQSEIRESIKKR